MGSLDDEKDQIEARITGNERTDVARDAMIKRIKEESGYAVHQDVLDEVLSSLGDDFLSFQWATPELPNKSLLSFEDGSGRTNIQFVNFLNLQARERMRSKGAMTPSEVGESLFAKFADDACIEYAERKLPEKYPDFANLMREYEEGILLFEVTKRNIWDQAGTDSAGLAEFFAANRDRYMWPERAELTEYRVETADPEVIAKALELSEKLTPIDWADKMNRKENIASFSRSKMERERLEATGATWAEGWVYTPRQTDSTYTFTRITSIETPEQKELDEARGYVIADYQDYLEKQWIAALREKYEVVVNEDVLEAMTR